MSADLGQCVAEYKTSAAGYVKLLAIMLACSAAACGLIFFSITSNDSNIPGRVIMFLFGLLFSLPGVLGVYGLMKGRKNAVRMHERGIVIHKSGVDNAVLFDDVAAYSDGSFLVVVTKNGESFDFGLDGLAAAPDLFSRLRDEVVVKCLVPSLRKTIEAGDTLEFDGGEIADIAQPAEDVAVFTVDAKGITLSTDSKRQLAWHEIVECGSTEKVSSVGKMMLTTTSIFVKTKTETIQAAVDPLSDREAMLMLCNEMMAAMIRSQRVR
jgi:hypothetical protein